MKNIITLHAKYKVYCRNTRTFLENGHGTRITEQQTVLDSGKRGKIIVIGFRKDTQAIEQSNDQPPPPTYEAALKMMTETLSLGSLPNSPVYWPENDAINESGILSFTVSEGNVADQQNKD